MVVTHSSSAAYVKVMADTPVCGEWSCAFGIVVVVPLLLLVL